MKGGLYEDGRKRESRSDVEESTAAASCLNAVSGAQREGSCRPPLPLTAAEPLQDPQSRAESRPNPGLLRPKLSSYRLKPSGTSEGGCRRRGAAPQWISG